MTIYAPGARQEQTQRQTLTPRLQEAVRLLQLSSLDFAQEVRQAVSTNPFLEADENDSDVAPAAEPVAGSDGAASDAGESNSLDTSAAAETPWESSNWSQFGQRNGHSGDVDSDIGEITPAVPSLHEHLRTDLGLLTLSDRDRVIAATLIEALDDDGYLRIGLDEVARLTDLSPEPEEDEMHVALRIVQSLEPGVAARDLRECLQLQLQARRAQLQDPRNGTNGDARPSARLEAQKAAAIQALAEKLVADHLERVAANDISGLARELREKETTVEAAADLIKHLEPHPGWRFGGPGARYVTPDVIARKVRNKWTVVLNTEIVPRVRLNRMYADLFREHRDSSHGDLAAQLQEARWTVRKVEQRFATILRVAEAIIARQHQFLELGQIAMKPLCLREIADELGLHESTVSRVTNNKYIATPAGVFELKYFFSRALPTSSGATCSTAAIRGAIKDMIAAEDARAPLSDARIARLLARQGLRVARRTVTKYRQMMRVPSYELRQRLHA